MGDRGRDVGGWTFLRYPPIGVLDPPSFVIIKESVVVVI
jgi:hypothetical protein